MTIPSMGSCQPVPDLGFGGIYNSNQGYICYAGHYDILSRRFHVTFAKICSFNTLAIGKLEIRDKEKLLKEEQK